MESLLQSVWLWPILFIAQFAQVFALVMNSKLLRDDRWILAMCNSWTISITQFIFVYIVAQAHDVWTTFFVAAIGGSLGCGASHLFYTRFIFKGK
ncbi:holin [Vibrio phage 526E57-1]